MAGRGAVPAVEGDEIVVVDALCTNVAGVFTRGDRSAGDAEKREEDGRDTHGGGGREMIFSPFLGFFYRCSLPSGLLAVYGSIWNNVGAGPDSVGERARSLSSKVAWPEARYDAPIKLFSDVA